MKDMRGHLDTTQFRFEVSPINAAIRWMARTLWSDTHFVFHFKVVVGSCSGSLKAAKGAIASPEFPGSYPLDGRTCQWVVDVSENGDTAVKFPVFNLAEGDELRKSAF